MFREFNGDARPGVGNDADLAVTVTEIRMKTAQATERSKPPFLFATCRYPEVTRVVRLLLMQP
jgi:hypothetical protein